MDKSTVNFVNLTEKTIKITVVDKNRYKLDGVMVNDDFFEIDPGKERRLTNNKVGGADINVHIDLTGYDFKESHWKFNTEFRSYFTGEEPRWTYSKIVELSNGIHYDAESALTKRPAYYPPNKHCYSSELFYDRENAYFDERIWANYGALSSPSNPLACLDNAGPGGKPVFVTRWFGYEDGRNNKYDLVIQDI